MPPPIPLEKSMKLTSPQIHPLLDFDNPPEFLRDFGPKILLKTPVGFPTLLYDNDSGSHLVIKGETIEIVRTISVGNEIFPGHVLQPTEMVAMFPLFAVQGIVPEAVNEFFITDLWSTGHSYWHNWATIERFSRPFGFPLAQPVYETPDPLSLEILKALTEDSESQFFLKFDSFDQNDHTFRIRREHNG